MKRELAAAFAAGAGAMALEMLASRWLAPGFGSAIETWSLLIAATLLAGALGAALAASIAPRASAALALLSASALLALAALVQRELVDALLPLPLLVGAALGAALLVGPPCLALGAVLPLLAERCQARGARGMGALVAASTAGSLAGTLVAALWMMPSLGLRATALLVAAFLALAALLVARGGAARGAALLALLACGGASFTHSKAEELQQLSPYGTVELRPEGQALRLRVDGIAQGVFAPLAPPSASWLAGGQWFALLPYLHPRGRAALQIGLGLGEGARLLEAHGIAVLSVELDPLVAELARTRGHAQGPIHIGDGRAFWRRSSERFDFVLLDAFQGETTPEHLLSMEALRELRSRLRSGGIVAVHVIGRSESSACAAVWRTLGEVFSARLALRTARGDGLEDLFFFASDAPLALPPHSELASAEPAQACFEPPVPGALLTDDENPLAALQAVHARALRRASIRASRE